MRRTFTRRNGDQIVIEVSVDLDKLIEDMAHSMVLKGKNKITKAGGAIVATIVDVRLAGA